MENTIILTIVVPVYNVQDTLVRCLDSIPKRSDIELICCDDFSNDNSWIILNKWYHANVNKFGNFILMRNESNMGVGYTKNLMYKKASGKYISTIDSDDYVYTDNYSIIIDKLYERHDNDEILILDHDDNSGSICMSMSCNATWRYFIQLKYLRDNNIEINPTYRRAEDWFMMRDVEKLNPKFTRLDIHAYHYNYPRKGSISWNWEHLKKV